MANVRLRVKKTAQEEIDGRKDFPADKVIKVPVEGHMIRVSIPAQPNVVHPRQINIMQPQAQRTGWDWLMNGLVSGAYRVGLFSRPIPHTDTIEIQPGRWREQQIVLTDNDNNDPAFINDLRQILHDSYYALYERAVSADHARQIINSLTSYIILMLQLVQQTVTDQTLAPYFHIATGAIELIGDFITTIILPIIQNKAVHLHEVADASISQLDSKKSLNDWFIHKVSEQPDFVAVPTQFRRAGLFHIVATRVNTKDDEMSDDSGLEEETPSRKDQVVQELVNARAKLGSRAMSADTVKSVLTGLKGLIISGIALSRYIDNDPTTNATLNITVAAIEATFTFITTIVAHQVENKAVNYSNIAKESLDAMNDNKIVFKGSVRPR